MPRSIGSARLVWIFSATWCPGLAAGKFCSPTRPATSSSCSNPPAPDRPLEPGGHQPKHRKEDAMTEHKPLAGRVALVAGATRGAGRAMAVELARAGADVYATGRSSRTAGPSEI